MAKRNHKWTKEEEDILYNNNSMSPKKIKEEFFPDIDAITVQAIADKVSRVTDQRDQANYGKPWNPEDEKYLTENLGLTNSYLKPVLKRGSKELDQAKWDIRHKGGINPKRQQRIKVTPIDTNVLSKAAVRAYKLLEEFKAIDIDVIEEIRATRVKFHNNPEPVQVFDYLKMPTTDDLNRKSELFQVFKNIKNRVEELNEITLDKPGKDATISTHQFNLLRQFFCLRVTSHKNLNIQNNVVELQNLTRAVAEHLLIAVNSTKAIPRKKPFPRNSAIPRKGNILNLAKLRSDVMDLAINKFYQKLGENHHASHHDFIPAFKAACDFLGIRQPIFDGKVKPENSEIHERLLLDNRFSHYEQQGMFFYVVK